MEQNADLMSFDVMANMPQRVFSEIVFPIQIKEGFVLRPFKTEDAKDLACCIERNRKFLRKTLSWLDSSCSEANSLQFIERAIAGYTDETHLNLCIDHNKSIVGTVSFNEIKKEDESGDLCGVLGYWLDQSMTGKGIMTDAVKVLIEIGFNFYTLNKVFISCGTTNIKSQQIADRLGFEQLHRVKDAEILYGEVVNHYLYVLLRYKWKWTNRLINSVTTEKRCL